MSDLGNASKPLVTSITRRAGLAALFAATFAVIGLTAPSPSFAENKKAIKVGIISGDDEDV
ncbi:metal ABC transporter substrate-binding protein, partial [Mesorhizobium sp. M3A.F.Ca.ET.175.01.1.1]